MKEHIPYEMHISCLLLALWIYEVKSFLFVDFFVLFKLIFPQVTISCSCFFGNVDTRG